MPDTKERPILFSGEMVRAILEGRKTQTRRVVKILRTDVHPQVGATIVTLPGGKQAWLNSQSDHPHHISKFCPYGVLGDRLWVRETFCCQCIHEKYLCYKADKCTCHGDPCTVCHWRPSIHMPRRASRITLEVICVRVERLQGISEDDAKSEGAEPIAGSHRNGFESLWDYINAKRGFEWNVNPWVWVIEFRRIENA